MSRRCVPPRLGIRSAYVALPVPTWFLACGAILCAYKQKMQHP